MRQIKLTGREASVVRAIGFAESMLGTEIQDHVRMESEDLTDTLNGLIAAGFVETIPYCEQVQLAEMPVTAFELNPAYVHDLREAMVRRGAQANALSRRRCFRRYKIDVLTLRLPFAKQLADDF